MNSRYKILWIDDDNEWVDSNEFAEKKLLAEISSEGFVPIIERRTSDRHVAKEVRSTDADLLLIDFNLSREDGVSGSELLARIKDQALHMEIIFYSQNPMATLFQEIATKRLEGVYVSPRNTLFNKAKQVFDFSVRKVLDLENMRGIIVAGVAEIDQTLTALISQKHLKLDEVKQIELRGKIVRTLLPNAKKLAEHRVGATNEMIEALESALQSLSALKPDSIDPLLDSIAFASMNRLEIVRSLCKDFAYLSAYKSSIKDVKSLLHWRNALAHQLPEEGADLNRRFRVNGRDELFSREKARELRLKVISDRALLKDILEKIQNR
jgi:CheY-like chemotaxis protein